MKSEVRRVFFVSSIVCHLVNTKKYHVSLHNGANLTLDSQEPNWKAKEPNWKAKEPNSPAEKGDYSVGLNFTAETEDVFDSYDDANEFKPQCHENPYAARGISGFGPTKIGGNCFGKEDTKDCDGECLRQDQPCRGKCGWNQCRQGDQCREMFEDGRLDGKILLRECEGKCQAADALCDGKCDSLQCHHVAEERCLQPEHEGGGELWKSCQGECIKVGELCDSSCGDKDKFCWDQGENMCKSVTESAEGAGLIRRGCHCVCIPFQDQCEEKCGRRQCADNNKCLDEMEVDKDGERIRTSCSGNCVPWDTECTF